MVVDNSYKEQTNHRMKIHYYMLRDINKRLNFYEDDIINIQKLIKNNDKNKKRVIILTYSLIISNLIIIYLIFTK